MKIVLICPSNMLYMPYVYNYTEILDDLNADYDIITWDRFNIENQNVLTYRDAKNGHKRNFLDYYKYSRFIFNIIKKNKYDKVIIFGVQLLFFLKRYLLKEYKERFIIDIRDYNKIIEFFSMKKIIDNSSFTVLSSHGYKEWLPASDKYIVNHNTQIKKLDQLTEISFEINNHNEKLQIGYIGALRDYKVNITFIESLKNNNSIQVFYHGEGDINSDIEEYIESNNIKNVILTGRYERQEEQNIYAENNIINVLRYNDGINNRTALPNRLYNSIIYGKPMLAFEGTELAQIIRDYDLGLVISSFDNLDITIDNYIKNFNVEKYNFGRKKFMKQAILDNVFFQEKLIEFIH